MLCIVPLCRMKWDLYYDYQGTCRRVRRAVDFHRQSFCRLAGCARPAGTAASVTGNSPSICSSRRRLPRARSAQSVRSRSEMPRSHKRDTNCSAAWSVSCILVSADFCGEEGGLAVAAAPVACLIGSILFISPSETATVCGDRPFLDCRQVSTGQRVQLGGKRAGIGACLGHWRGGETA